MVSKVDLAKVLSQNNGLSASVTAGMMTDFLGLVLDHLRRGEDVALTGFGTFKAVTTPARRGRNPATGEAIDIPERKGAKFKFAPSAAQSFR